MLKKKAPKKLKVARLSKYGSAYKVDKAGFLICAPIQLDNKIDEAAWGRVELSAIEGELDVKKFRGTLTKKLGRFKITA